MKEKLNELIKKYPSLKIEEDKYISYQYEEVDGKETYKEIPQTRYLLSGVPDNEDIVFVLINYDQVDGLENFLESKPLLFKDFLGLTCKDYIEVQLATVGRAPGLYRWHEEGKPIDISMNFFGNDLSVRIESSPKESLLNFVSSIMRGVRSRSKNISLKIYNFKKHTQEGAENDTRNVLNSILFDIEYTYSMAFETVNVENLKLKRRFGRRPGLKVPNDAIELVYKRYIPELIEYYHIGEKVDYLPFKYICYFHIIEYFMDKSAYSLVAKKVKQLISKPDFHTKSNEYIAQAINIFKKENDKYTADKIKITRVFNEFIERDEVNSYLDEIGLLDHFSQEVTLNCRKPLKVSAIKFDADQAFFESLTKRIYSLRCSIVHSNPEFDESKAIPFAPIPENMEFLRKEINLIMEISRNIIVKSCGL